MDIQNPKHGKMQNGLQIQDGQFQDGSFQDGQFQDGGFQDGRKKIIWNGNLSLISVQT